MDACARERVLHASLVDPLAKMLEVWRLDSEKWLRIGTWVGDAEVSVRTVRSTDVVAIYAVG
jgi:hypothetical protein